MSVSNIDWTDILETLQDEKCALFIGSSAYQFAGDFSMDFALIKWLKENKDYKKWVRLYKSDGFFLFKKNRYKRKIISAMREFYNQSFPETEQLFSKISQIPFTMIFSLTPDNILARTFDVNGLPYQSDFYYRNRKASDHVDKPTIQKPLIYNLLGNIEEPESLVLTHGDFFDYLNSVFQGNSMNSEIRHELENAERYIFLGLPYEKWYFQLLLRVLSMHSEKLREVERLALKEFENPQLHELYTEEFKMEFIPSDIPIFIESLYNKCQEQGILKTVAASDPREKELPAFSAAQVKQFIAEAKTEEAMLHLKVFFDQHKPIHQKTTNDLVVLRNRYNLLKQRDRRGTIFQQDFQVENNQIVEQLLDLVGKTESL